MTDQQINTAIAEACGFESVEFDSSKPWSWPSGIVTRFTGTPSECRVRVGVPNYCHDLNAMHEAEKILNEKQQVWYLQELTQVRYKDGVSGMLGCMIDKTTFATARQRAEAFLRTIGKWRDE